MVKPASSVLYIQAPENFLSIEVIGQYVATPSWDLWLNFDLGLRGGEQSESRAPERANFFFGPTFDLEHYYSESCNLIGQLEVN